MSSPKESKEQKPSSSEQQPPRENSPQNNPDAQERRVQNDSNVTQREKSDEGDNNAKESQGGNQVQTVQNKTDATGSGGDAAETETKGSGGDNVKGQESGASATGGSIGTSASILLTKKRGRNGDPISVGTGSSSGSGSKGKVEVPSCPACKKTFPSWRGVFGHMKAHPRPTFWAFPPPTFTPPEGSPEKNSNNNKDEKTLEEQLAPTLLNLACQTLQTINQDSNVSDSTGAASSSSRTRGLDIDLNEPRTSVLLDTPPPEKEEDDDGDSPKLN